MSNAPDPTNPGAVLAKAHPVTVFRDFFEKRKDALAQIIPNTLSLDRVMKVALGAYARTPDLWECSIESVYQAINQAVQLGLEPGGPLGQAYIVPFKNRQTGKKEATLITGYKGLVTLMRRSGEVATVEAHIVHKEDFFDCQLGTDGYLKHKPVWDKDPGPMLAVYYIITTKDGYKTWEVMRKSQIDAIRNGSAGKNSPAWTGHYEEMARKTAIRRGAKFAPMSIEAATALAGEDDADARGEPIDVSSLADGAMILPGDDSQEAPPEPRPAMETNAATPERPAPVQTPPVVPVAPAEPTAADVVASIRGFITAAKNENAIVFARGRIESAFQEGGIDSAQVRELFTLLLAQCKTRPAINQVADLIGNLEPDLSAADLQAMAAEVEQAKGAKGIK